METRGRNPDEGCSQLKRFRGEKKKECDNAEEKPGGSCVCVCVCVYTHTLSLTHLVLVGSVGLQRCTIAGGDTRAHDICFGRRWNHSKTITVKAFLPLQVVNATGSVGRHYERAGSAVSRTTNGPGKCCTAMRRSQRGFFFFFLNSLKHLLL